MRQPRAATQPRSGDDGEPRLSQERILVTAIELVAREGEDALSMRRIGQELDVWPMSLYRYFHDKDALLDALAEAAAADIHLPSARGSWQTQLRGLLRELNAAFAGHAGGRRLRVTGPDLPPAAAGVADHACTILYNAGLDAAHAQQTWQALVRYTHGAAHQSAEATFEYGLQLILDGIQARIGHTRMPREARVA